MTPLLQKKIEALVEKSVKAQHELQHYKSKLKEGEDAVRTTKSTLELVEVEFQVS